MELSIFYGADQIGRAVVCMRDSEAVNGVCIDSKTYGNRTHGVIKIDGKKVNRTKSNAVSRIGDVFVRTTQYNPGITYFEHSESRNN